MKSGVYIIKCLPTGKEYIGSAVNFANRFRVHKHRLRKNEHHNRRLQNAWNKYGEAAFEFKKLLCCAPSDVLFYEQRAIDTMKPAYNVATIAGNTLGYKFREDQKTALKAIRQKFHTENPGATGRKFMLDGVEYNTRTAGTAFGIDPKNIAKRLRKGMSFEDAVKTPLKPGGGRQGRPKYEYNGELLRVIDIARLAGERTTLIHKWIAKGFTVEDMISGRARQRVHTK